MEQNMDNNMETGNILVSYKDQGFPHTPHKPRAVTQT